MSLFLSKLLPIFVYPLGLSSLLVMAALIVLAWNKKRSPKPSPAKQAIALYRKKRLAVIMLSVALGILIASKKNLQIYRYSAQISTTS